MKDAASNTGGTDKKKSQEELMAEIQELQEKRLKIIKDPLSEYYKVLANLIQLLRTTENHGVNFDSIKKEYQTARSLMLRHGFKTFGK